MINRKEEKYRAKHTEGRRSFVVGSQRKSRTIAKNNCDPVI